MTHLFKQSVLTILSEQCYDKYFVEFNMLDVECFKALLSKVLGIGLIAGSMLVKVPQIIKIWNAKSATGINIVSVLLDLVAITCHMAYSYVSGFPFTSWGDTSFLAIQTALIAALVFLYSGKPNVSVIFTVLYGVICYVLMGGFTPKNLLWSAQGLNIPILFGKLSQAVTNFKAKSTGQLSAITCFMLFFGSLARIFTSVQETGDSMMILTYLASSFANAVIVFQLVLYWNSDKVASGDEKKQKLKSKKIN
ncbi:LOW QUALITY PROTEIN: mannose-P-dolichol utilization defect 1 protein homolog [Culicoides brevitarsis]|uniref:LOW QUALITY PROTEIN: mannose-P-dolichol utilization defect 1 protein homolog n=1 Tax=Culicoides brevitarsis TaxID=469753 RepID=UPI00307BA8C9